MQTTFNFTGKLFIPGADSRTPFASDTSWTRKTRSGEREIPAIKMNFGIRETDANMGFVSLYASKDSTQELIVHTAEGSTISVPWEEREEYVDIAANFMKYIVDLADPEEKAKLRDAIRSGDLTETDCETVEQAKLKLSELYNMRKEFITSYDFASYIREVLPSYEGRVTVTGNVRRSYYNNKYSDTFEPRAVYAASSDTKNKLSMKLGLIYNKDSIEKAKYDSEKKIFVNGYVYQWINSVDKNKLMPLQLIFDASKYNLENERHKKLLDYKLKYVDIDNETYQELLWEVRIINGAEVVEFTEDMLTDSQREQVELGLKTLDDFRPRGNIYGERIREYRLADPVLKGRFESGMVDTEYNSDDIEKLLYSPNKVEDASEMGTVKADVKKSVTEEPEIDDDDLF